MWLGVFSIQMERPDLNAQFLKAMSSWDSETDIKKKSLYWQEMWLLAVTMATQQVLVKLKNFPYHKQFTNEHATDAAAMIMDRIKNGAIVQGSKGKKRRHWRPTQPCISIHFAVLSTLYNKQRVWEDKHYLYYADPLQKLKYKGEEEDDQSDDFSSME